MMRIFIVIVCSFCCAYTDGIQEDQSCFTPDGKWGTCVELSDCPVLANLSVKNNYKKISRCEGPDRSKTSVCCGPPREIIVRRTSNCPKTVAPPDPRTACCGCEAAMEDRIVGGNVTSIYQYPWLVRLEHVNERSKRVRWFCGGSLVSSKYVLTAAHCVSHEQPQDIILGDYNRTQDGPDCVDGSCTDGAIRIPIEEIIISPDYQKNTTGNAADIALIRLKDDAPYTEFIRPICLPTSDLRQKRNLKKVYLFVVGWGLTELGVNSDVKIHVKVPYVPNRECEKPYGYENLSTSVLCAGGEAGRDSCTGDSGGPLMHYANGMYTLVGIVSSGPIPCGKERIPGLYTNVYEYLPWLRTQIKP